MLRMHGTPVSNYFNVVRAALIEKQLNFEVVITGARQDAAFLALSPMGKVPVLETPGGWIAESVAILEYLDDAFPALSLRPTDVMARARGRQIINVVQMYVEAPARSLFPGVFSDAPLPPESVSAASKVLDRAVAALNCLLSPRPFVNGDALTSADLFAFYNLDIADRVTRFAEDRSLFDDIGTLAEWRAMMLDRSSTRAVLADFEVYFANYLVDHRAPYRPEGSLTHA
jgi:glutathione S-transferase